MSAPVHQSFTTDLNTKPFEAGLSRMETATRTSTSRVAREFDRVTSRAGVSRLGQAAMQFQDIGVQMQSGARASTIIAQQGSQILSVFGPHGMLLGGLVAAGAMFWEVVRGAKALNKEAQEAKKLKDIQANTQAMKQANDQLRTDQDATKLAEIRAKYGEEAAKAAERELAFRSKIVAIENNANLNPEAKAVLKEAAGEREKAEARVRARERGVQGVAEEGDRINRRAEAIAGTAEDRANFRREEWRDLQRRARNGDPAAQGRLRDRNIATRSTREERATRRAIKEEMDAIDRDERNNGQGTGKARGVGLTEEERRRGEAARQQAAEVAKDKKMQAEISQENIDKILNGIHNLIAK